MPDRAGPPHAGPAVDRLSSRTLGEIVRLERAWNQLRPGDVGRALSRWREYVHRPARELWHDDEFGNVHGYCCGDPREGRALLDEVARGMSRRGARELRAVVERLDAFMGPPVPACGTTVPRPGSGRWAGQGRRGGVRSAGSVFAPQRTTQTLSPGDGR
ncbi:hypothetical protein ACWEPR_13470 [Streptomyces sp. NPDC004290]